MTKKRQGSKSSGYGKPPQHSQFKPGQSGNPNGRPTKSKNTKKMLDEMLSEKVTVTLGNRRTRVSRLEVMVRSAVKKAAQGDPRAFRNVVRWSDEFTDYAEERSKTKVRSPVPKPSSMHRHYRQLYEEALAEIEEWFPDSSWRRAWLYVEWGRRDEVAESPRDCRRLHFLRGWSHGTSKQVFT